MLRAVIAVSLATALLGIGLAGLDTARHEHSDAQVRGEIEHLTAAIHDVHAREAAVGTSDDAARRVVTLRLPERDWTNAGIDYVQIGGTIDQTDAGGNVSDAAGGTIGYRVAGNHEQHLTLDGIRIEGGPSGERPLVIGESGTHRLAVSLVDRDGNRTVVVERLG